MQRVFDKSPITLISVYGGIYAHRYHVSKQELSEYSGAMDESGRATFSAIGQMRMYCMVISFQLWQLLDSGLSVMVYIYEWRKTICF